MNREQFLSTLNFISYESIDPVMNYGMMGYSTISVGDRILTFKHIRAKDGNEFFQEPKMTVNLPTGDKRYVSIHTLDSRIQSEWQTEFLKENYSLWKAKFGGQAEDSACPF